MISEQIDLELLRTYVAVCRQGSLSRVAEQTHRTQSGLSMQMRRLEGLLDRQLFQRTGRGVVPTAEGEIFLGYATRILALSDEALASLRRTQLSGSVRVGLAEEVATSALPAALGRLHRAYPDLRLDVVVENSVALGRLWQEEQLDVLIAAASAVVADAVEVWNVELEWACAQDYEIEPQRPLDLVAFAAPCLWRRRMLDALVERGREHRVTFTSQSVTALQVAIENGLGIGVLPHEAIRAGSSRTLEAASGIPGPLLVQYGLFARDTRAPAVDAVLGVLALAIPAQSPRVQTEP
jgi:DNA-binding transcriptional LysR family regulator